MPEESSNSAIKNTVEAVQGVLKEVPIYQDLAQPTVQLVGKTLAGAVKLALAPITGLIWSYDTIATYLEPALLKRFANKSEEKIISPASEIVGPSIEALRFSGHNEELRELYANIIATSMDSETAAKAHPSFVEILKNLCSDECKMLKNISKIAVPPVIRIIPAVDIVLYNNDNSNKYTCIYQNHSSLSFEGLMHPNFYNSYINNLCRLGLIEIPEGVTATNEESYEELENASTANSLSNKLSSINNKKQKIGYIRKAIAITNFGKQFCEAVLGNTSQL